MNDIKAIYVGRQRIDLGCCDYQHPNETLCRLDLADYTWPEDRSRLGSSWGE